MITKFSVTNYKSIKDKITLDLTTNANYDFSTFAVNNGIVVDAMLYGLNGSGKTDLGLALMDIKKHVNNWYQYAFVPYIEQSNISSFEYTFNIDDNIIQYNYGKALDGSFQYEELYINSELYYEWDKQSNSHFPYINKEYDEWDNNYIIKQQNDQDIIESLMEFINGMKMVSCKNSLNLTDDTVSLYLNYLESNSLYSEWEHAVDKIHSLSYDYKAKNLVTRDFLKIFYALYTDGTFLYIDDFAIYDDHVLAEEILKYILSCNCQNIITTYNTNLMTNDLLRPDCYYIIKNGLICSLHKSTLKEIRKAHNLSKMYVANSFDEYFENKEYRDMVDNHNIINFK